MDKPRPEQDKAQAVQNTGDNGAKMPPEDGSRLGHESGGAASDKDSNVSAEAGNPNGRGAGKDPGPLTRETDRHDSQSRDQETRERIIKERGMVPDSGARRGDLEAPTSDHGGSYSPSNNGRPVGGTDKRQQEHTRHDGVRRGDH
jgi:hypothetical protein